MPEPTDNQPKQSVLGHIKNNWKKYALGAAAGSVIGAGATLGTLKYGIKDLADRGYEVRIIKNQNHPMYQEQQ